MLISEISGFLVKHHDIIVKCRNLSPKLPWQYQVVVMATALGFPIKAAVKSSCILLKIMAMPFTTIFIIDTPSLSSVFMNAWLTLLVMSQNQAPDLVVEDELDRHDLKTMNSFKELDVVLYSDIKHIERVDAAV